MVHQWTPITCPSFKASPTKRDDYGAHSPFHHRGPCVSLGIVVGRRPDGSVADLHPERAGIPHPLPCATPCPSSFPVKSTSRWRPRCERHPRQREMLEEATIQRLLPGGRMAHGLRSRRRPVAGAGRCAPRQPPRTYPHLSNADLSAAIERITRPVGATTLQRNEAFRLPAADPRLRVGGPADAHRPAEREVVHIHQLTGTTRPKRDSKSSISS